MATVQEIMNRELLAIAPGLPSADARDLLCSFRVSSAPVVDDANHPVGIVSLGDVAQAQGFVRDRMSRPAPCVDSSTAVETAARLLATSDEHHLVVVDAGGAAVGIVSTLDVLRALVGVPSRHPASFPHWDASTGASWTDDWPLDERGATQVPDTPGVLALLRVERSGAALTVAWVEGCANVRARARALVSGGATADEPELARVLTKPGALYLRAAPVAREDERLRIVTLIRDWLEHMPPPGAT